MAEEKQKNTHKIKLSFDLRWVMVFLVSVIVALVFSWHPWHRTHMASDRTVSVSGDTTIKAEADEFAFSPSYVFTGNNQPDLIARADSKKVELVKKLVTLGVEEKRIKIDTYGYDTSPYPVSQEDGQLSYTLYLSFSVSGKELASTIEDYIQSSGATGAITAVPQFSREKATELQDKARVEAMKDARKKAEQSAKELGFDLGDVKKVEDGQFPVYPGVYYDTKASVSSETGQGVYPGLNEYSYTVTVEYYIK